MTIIAKITKPTNEFPLTTKFPKASITFPAYPFSKISLVDDIFKDSLSIVATSKREGKTEKSRGFSVFMDISRIIKEKVILNTNSKSSMAAGMGITIIKIIRIAIIAMVISPIFIS